MSRSDAKLEKLLVQAKTQVLAMTTGEREKMYEAQRASFVRGQLARCEHGMLDFEQCPKCRG